MHSNSKHLSFRGTFGNITCLCGGRLSVSPILIGRAWHKIVLWFTRWFSVLQLDWESWRTHPFLQDSTTSALAFPPDTGLPDPQTEACCSSRIRRRWPRSKRPHTWCKQTFLAISITTAPCILQRADLQPFVLEGGESSTQVIRRAMLFIAVFLRCFWSATASRMLRRFLLLIWCLYVGVYAYDWKYILNIKHVCGLNNWNKNF